MHQGQIWPPAEAGDGFAPEVARRVGGLWSELAEVTVDVDAVSRRVEAQVEHFARLRECSSHMLESNSSIAEAARLAKQVAEMATEQIANSQRSVEALADIRALAHAATEIERKLHEVVSNLGRVTEVAGRIEAIARQTRMLALNATIEAARAGDAGRGFGIVANEVKALAQQTSDATSRIAETVQALTTAVQALASESAGSVDTAGRVRQATDEIAEAFDDFGTVVSLIDSHVEEIAHAAEGNLQECQLVTSEVDVLTTGIERESAHLTDASTRTGKLLRMSEELIETVVVHGLEIVDSPFIDAAIAAAGRATGVVELAVLHGQATPETLSVDEGLALIADRLRTEALEPLLSFDDRVVYCAAVTAEGRVAVHLSRRPAPIAAGAVLDDPVSRRAAANDRSFIVQTYRWDMGDGEPLLMKDASAPVWLNGRHWGAIRLGYRA